MQESLKRVRFNATKCRELADTAITADARDVLADLADRYEQEAARLEHLDEPRRRRPAFKWSLA